MELGSKHLDLFRGKDAASPLVLVNGQGGSAAGIFSDVSSRVDADFHLAVVSNLDWNNELTPWPASGLGRGLSPMKGEGRTYLRFLENEALPGAVKEMGIRPSAYYLAGYSLAGLFALYAALEENLFAKAASVSGSLWYPGFLDWVQAAPRPSSLSYVYLSYGKKEPESRNPILQTVGKRTEDIASSLRDKGIAVDLELNPGNHFEDAELRLVKGIARLLS